MENTKYPSLEKQWKKMMFSFFPYQSMKHKYATKEEWRVRKLIWAFKDGKEYVNVAHLVANKLVQLYGEEVKNVILRVCRHQMRRRTRYAIKTFLLWSANCAER